MNLNLVDSVVIRLQGGCPKSSRSKSWRIQLWFNASGNCWSGSHVVLLTTVLAVKWRNRYVRWFHFGQKVKCDIRLFAARVWQSTTSCCNDIFLLPGPFYCVRNSVLSRQTCSRVQLSKKTFIALTNDVTLLFQLFRTAERFSFSHWLCWLSPPSRFRTRQLCETCFPLFNTFRFWWECRSVVWQRICICFSRATAFMVIIRLTLQVFNCWNVWLWMTTILANALIALHIYTSLRSFADSDEQASRCFVFSEPFHFTVRTMVNNHCLAGQCWSVRDLLLRRKQRN